MFSQFYQSLYEIPTPLPHKVYSMSLALHNIILTFCNSDLQYIQELIGGVGKFGVDSNPAIIVEAVAAASEVVA